MNSRKEELEEFRKVNGPLIDVRSPSEYYKGHMPNSINIPLFDNEERSIVGTIYKNYGREKAVIQGLEYIAIKIENLVNKLFEAITVYKSKNHNSKLEESTLKIYCARGGMRSQSISWLLEKYNQRNIRLKDGYKSYRKWSLDSFNKKWEIIVIGGKTGVGKSKFNKEELVSNIKFFVETISKDRPAGVKGEFIKSVSISPTMGPGIKLDLGSLGI